MKKNGRNSGRSRFVGFFRCGIIRLLCFRFQRSCKNETVAQVDRFLPSINDPKWPTVSSFLLRIICAVWTLPDQKLRSGHCSLARCVLMNRQSISYRSVSGQRVSLVTSNHLRADELAAGGTLRHLCAQVPPVGPVLLLMCSSH